MSELGQKIIAETRKVAAERPEFVFKDWCQYVADGQPACIMGHALWNLGLVGPTLEGHAINEDGLDQILDHLDLAIDEPEREWLLCAQEQQDCEYPWGEAVAYADERVGT